MGGFADVGPVPQDYQGGFGGYPYSYTEPAPVVAVVEYEFNRPFTWSERETFRDLFEEPDDFKWVSDKRVRITSNALDSREVTEQVSLFVATRYLNIHPVVARTVKPKENV